MARHSASIDVAHSQVIAQDASPDSTPLVFPPLTHLHHSFNGAATSTDEDIKAIQHDSSLPPRKSPKYCITGKLVDFEFRDARNVVARSFNHKPQDINKKLKSTVRKRTNVLKKEVIDSQRLEISLTKVDLKSRKRRLPVIKKNPRGPKTYVSQEVDTNYPDYNHASPLLVREETPNVQDELSRILGLTLEDARQHLRRFRVKESIVQSVEHMVKEQAHRRGVCRHRRQRSVGKVPSVKRLTRKFTDGDQKVWDRTSTKFSFQALTIGNGWAV